MSDETPVPAEAADAQTPTAPAETESLVQRVEDAVRHAFEADATEESPTPEEASAPEPEPAPVTEPVSLEDAVRAVITFVRAHRTIGDADLAAAVADVEAALPAQE